MWFRFEQVLRVVKALSVLTMKLLVGLLKNNCRFFYLDNVNKQHRMDDKNTCRKIHGFAGLQMQMGSHFPEWMNRT